MCWVFYGCLQKLQNFWPLTSVWCMELHAILLTLYVYHKMAKRRCCIKTHWSYGLVNAAPSRTTLKQLYLHQLPCPVQVMSYAHDVIPPTLHLCRWTPNWYLSLSLSECNSEGVLTACFPCGCATAVPPNEWIPNGQYSWWGRCLYVCPCCGD